MRTNASGQSREGPSVEDNWSPPGIRRRKAEHHRAALLVARMANALVACGICAKMAKRADAGGRSGFRGDYPSSALFSLVQMAVEDGKSSGVPAALVLGSANGPRAKRANKNGRCIPQTPRLIRVRERESMFRRYHLIFERGNVAWPSTRQRKKPRNRRSRTRAARRARAAPC